MQQIIYQLNISKNVHPMKNCALSEWHTKEMIYQSERHFKGKIMK